MRCILLSCCILLLCSCGHKDYKFADETLDFLEDLVDAYEEAENMDSLNAIYNRALLKQKSIAKEQQESHNELIKDIELLDEHAYLVHLNLLSAESHAQWMYYKRTKDFESEEENK